MSLSIPSGSAHIPATSSPARSKAEKAAQDFEPVLLGSLLESLQKTFAAVPKTVSSAAVVMPRWEHRRWQPRCPRTAASESRG